MSLINEALRRTRDSEREVPPAPPNTAELRPAEYRPPPKAWAFYIFPLILILLLAALGLVLVKWWRATEHTRVRPVVVNATTRSPAPPTRIAATALETQRTPAPTPAPVVAPAIEPRKVASVSHPQVVQPAASEPARAMASVSAPEPSNAVSVAQAPVPAPVAFKLQAIFYHPSHPSVIINGKTLFVGDQLGSARLTSVTSDSAALESPGQTNLLRLH